MGLFRRRARPVESPLHSWPQYEHPPVEFSGIASASLERPDFSPYAFQTDSGVWVRLHDMRFMGFDYQVQPSTLTLRFVYDDPEWTPPEATGTPVAVLRFSGVQVWQWEDDFDLFETSQEHRGQVSDLGYYEPTNVFSLLTLNSSLLFSASGLAVELKPRPRAEPQPGLDGCSH